MKCLGREHKQLERLGVRVLAISGDPPESHGRFGRAMGLRFDLLSDDGLDVAKRYGVFTPTPGGGFATRSVFLVDREGKLRFLDRDFRVPKQLAGTALNDAIEALGPGDHDPLADVEGLPEPERSGKLLLCHLIQAVIDEDLAAIDALLHSEFGDRPGVADSAAIARKQFLDRWKAAFEAEDFERARIATVLDLDNVKVLERDDASTTALRSFDREVRTLAAGMRKGDVLVAVRCRGLASDDGSKVLSRDVALVLRKEGEEWRIAALCGR